MQLEETEGAVDFELPPAGAAAGWQRRTARGLALIAPEDAAETEERTERAGADGIEGEESNLKFEEKERELAGDQ